MHRKIFGSLSVFSLRCAISHLLFCDYILRFYEVLTPPPQSYLSRTVIWNFNLNPPDPASSLCLSPQDSLSLCLWPHPSLLRILFKLYQISYTGQFSRVHIKYYSVGYAFEISNFLHYILHLFSGSVVQWGKQWFDQFRSQRISTNWNLGGFSKPNSL